MERNWIVAGGLVAALIWINASSGRKAYIAPSADPGGRFGSGAGAFLAALTPGEVNPPDPVVGPPPVPVVVSAASTPKVVLDAMAVNPTLRATAATPPAPAPKVVLPINSNLTAAANAVARAGGTPVVNIPALGPYVVATPGGRPGGATVPQIQRLNQLSQTYARALAPPAPYVPPVVSVYAGQATLSKSGRSL